MASERISILRKVYRNADGSRSRSAKAGWQALVFEFLAPNKDDKGNLVVLETVEFAKGAIPTEMFECAAGHGLSQKLGDTIASLVDKAKKAEPPVVADPERGLVDFAMELIQDAWDNIVQGVWVSEREGSSGAANVTILLEAIVAAFKDGGKVLTEEEIAAQRAKLADEDHRTKAREVPAVAAHVARIQAERAAERAKAARAKAKEAGASGMDVLLG